MYIKFNVWKFLLLCVLMHFTLSTSYAQSVTIRGKVFDEENLPLPGVSVKLKAASSGTSTDLNGNFSLLVPDPAGAVLTFSFIGCEPKELTLQSGQTNYTVRLQSSVSSLNEVVVVGYGVVLKKDLTGAVGSVNIQELNKAPVASFEQALAGRVAGVQVSSQDGQPGEGMNIVVRGNNSITQSNSPLYVVDGFPIEANINSTLNPSDIESIEVLKDASATAIYGARGANGVIMVTTKRGKTGEPTVSYQAFLGSQEEIKRIEVMNPFEFVKYQLEQDPVMYTPVYLGNGQTIESYRNAKGVDWQDKMFRNALIQNHSLSLSGGTDKTRYSISGAMLDQDGVIINGGYNRYLGRFAFDQEIGPRAKVGINVNYSSAKSFGTRVGDATGSPTSTLMYSIWGYRPVTGSATGDASLEFEPFDPDVNPATDLRFNPVVTATNTFNPQLTNTLFSNAFLEYDVLSNLKLRITGGLTRTHVNNQRFNNSNTQSGNPISSVNGVNGSISNSIRNNFLNENTLTYTPSLSKDHKLSVLGGFTNQQVRFENSGFTSIQIPNEVLGMSGIDEGIVTNSNSNRTVNTLASFLGRINYGFKNKYLFTASFRADGSSKFSDGNKWSYFPSGSVAWRFSEEPFMKSLSFISDAKLRGGFGMTGNNRVSDFAYLSSYQIVNDAGYSFNNAPLQGIVPNNLGTRDLTWETTSQTDIGLDLSFLNERISFTTDYYKKVTSDLLLDASLAPSMGYLTGFKNVGEVQNSGWEFSVNTRNITTDKFSWTTNFNISFNKNRVNKLSDDQADLQSRITWGNFSSTPYIAIPGSPIAQFNGYVFDGIYQFSDFDQANGTYVLKSDVPNNGMPRAQIQPGFVKYKDINSDGIVDAKDITTIGNPNPKHTGGFSNNFQYGGFDLNVFFQWSYGNDLMNVNRIVFEGGEPRNYLNQYASFQNRWTPENPSNTLYKAGGQGPLVYSSRIIEDGSYLRLKTVALGYNIPTALISRAKVKSMRVYVSGQNLLTWTNYSGVDPEVSVRHSALTPGFDLSAYPQTRTLTFGLNLSL